MNAIFRSFFARCLVFLIASSVGQSALGKPNILFIVADDLGYADCGVQGCVDIPTPHIDSIAKAGIRFTDAYVTGPVCSPSRAALMTGRYHQRDGVDDWVRPGGSGLVAEVPTIASYLSAAGYRCALIGKWHLGEEGADHPLRRGFEHFFGVLGGECHYLPDRTSALSQERMRYSGIFRNRDAVEPKEYVTDVFGREAVDFIRGQRDGARPFFLYLSFNAVHTPLEAPVDGLARFSRIADPRRRIYAAMLAAMDENIGRVLAALHETGLEKDTLICFLSDNGGPITRNAPNGATNTPLRGGKGQTWEGGIRVPMFMKWSGVLEPGMETRPVIQMDLTATALKLAGLRPDAAWPLDGIDLLPFLKGCGGDPHRMLCWEYEDQWAIRKGDWKLVFGESSGAVELSQPGLFDLRSDRSEAQDLAAKYPEKVQDMQRDWQAWSREVKGSKRVPSGDGWR